MVEGQYFMDVGGEKVARKSISRRNKTWSAL